MAGFADVRTKWGLASTRIRAQDDVLVELSIAEAAGRMAAGALTSVALTRAYLDRIERLEPSINAFISVTGETAPEEADRCDAERAAGNVRGLLHGIPVALKDNIDTAGVLTSAASAIFADRVPEADAECVRRLREAGAVLLGKTNLHEFAFGASLNERNSDVRMLSVADQRASPRRPSTLQIVSSNRSHWKSARLPFR